MICWPIYLVSCLISLLYGATISLPTQEAGMARFRELSKIIRSKSSYIEFQDDNIHKRRDIVSSFERFEARLDSDDNLYVSDAPQAVPRLEAQQFIQSVNSNIFGLSDEEVGQPLEQLIHRNQLELIDATSPRHRRGVEHESIKQEFYRLTVYLLALFDNELAFLNTQIETLRLSLKEYDASKFRRGCCEHELAVWLQEAKQPDQSVPRSDKSVIISSENRYLDGESSILPDLAPAEYEREWIRRASLFASKNERVANSRVRDARARLELLERRHTTVSNYVGEIMETFL